MRALLLVAVVVGFSGCDLLRPTPRATLEDLLADGGIRVVVSQTHRTHLGDGGIDEGRLELSIAFPLCPGFDGEATLNGEALEMRFAGGMGISGGLPPGSECRNATWRIPAPLADLPLDSFRISDGTAEVILEVARLGAERDLTVLSAPSEVRWGAPLLLAWSPPEDVTAVHWAWLEFDGGSASLLAAAGDFTYDFDGGVIPLELPDGGPPETEAVLRIVAEPKPAMRCQPEGVECGVYVHDTYYEFPVVVR